MTLRPFAAPHAWQVSTDAAPGMAGAVLLLKVPKKYALVYSRTVFADCGIKY